MAVDGAVLETVRIENDAVALAAELAKAGAQPEVAMEATLGWYWAADVIGECGARLHLAHPLGIKAFAYQRVKKDESDARLLADLLRMGRLPESWIAPPEIRELRELVRYRHKIEMGCQWCRWAGSPSSPWVEPCSAGRPDSGRHARYSSAWGDRFDCPNHGGYKTTRGAFDALAGRIHEQPTRDAGSSVVLAALVERATQVHPPQASADGRRAATTTKGRYFYDY